MELLGERRDRVRAASTSRTSSATRNSIAAGQWPSLAVFWRTIRSVLRRSVK
jgi:hypothetical protein